jgi:transcriptional regulator with XRE-family HTH domain
MSARLKWTRKQHGLTQQELAERSSVGLGTIRHIEQENCSPRFDTVARVAAALSVREAWLAYGEGEMVSLGQMTSDEQHHVHIGPGTEGLPGYVVIAPGGPWYRNEKGEWKVKRS